MYDLDKLVYLIKLAQGDRSQNAFALHCDISSASLTRYLKGERRPAPDALKSIALKAQNGVTYEALMIAAGYIEETDSPTHKGMSPEKKEAFFKGLDDLQLDKYKNLSPEDKELLAAQFNALIDRLEKGKK